MTAGVSCRPVGFPRAQRVPGQLTGNRTGLGRSWCPPGPGIREGLLLSQKQALATEREKTHHMPEMGFESEWDMIQKADFRASPEERNNIWEVLGVG